jgi:hypothetical protein
MLIRTVGGLIALMALTAGAAGAADSGVPMFSFTGYGTLGEVHSSEDKADFTTSVFKPNGAGASGAWSAAVDSLIAGQVTANFTPKLSGVLQVLSEQNPDDSYWPRVRWADIKYQFTPEFSARVGRIVLPSFLMSDVRKVGYALPWVRPPIEVYGLVPVGSNDGVDFSYALRIGEVQHTLAVTYGRIVTHYPLGVSGTARNQWSVADTMEMGPLTLHAEYQKARLTIDGIDQLLESFRNFGPPGVALDEKYDQDDKRVTFFGVGGIYDPGTWFLAAEWGVTDLHSALGRSSGWYASGGYRLANFTPYLTYARSKSDNLSDPGLPLAGLPPSLIGPALGLNAALNSLLSSKRVQNTISTGIRWDFARDVDLKLQFDHTKIGAGSSGGLVNLQPGFQPGGTLNLLSITIDFVF